MIPGPLNRADNAGVDFAYVDPEVFAVEAACKRIAPSEAKGAMSSRPVGRCRVYMQGAGSIPITLTLVDSESEAPRAYRVPRTLAQCFNEYHPGHRREWQIPDSRASTAVL